MSANNLDKKLWNVAVRTAMNSVRCNETTRALAECQVAYNILPVVPKKILKGPNGGYYYVNRNGKKIHLNKSQRKRFLEGKLVGVTNSSNAFNVRIEEEKHG